jgi:hypothetical protein
MCHLWLFLQLLITFEIFTTILQQNYNYYKFHLPYEWFIVIFSYENRIVNPISCITN